MAKDKNRTYKKGQKKKNISKSSSLSTKKKKNSFKYWNPTINLGYALFSVGFFFIMTSQCVGYDWIYNTLIKNTYDSADQIKGLTIDQKIESKMGFDAKFLLYLKAQTPEDAIILMPPYEQVKRKNDGGAFSNDSASISNVSWASYFVFPRKLVYEGTESEYRDKVTHVAIVDKWGYQFAPNIPEAQQQLYSVLKL